MLDRQYPATHSALSGHWRYPCFNENWKRSKAQHATIGLIPSLNAILWVISGIRLTRPCLGHLRWAGITCRTPWQGLCRGLQLLQKSFITPRDGACSRTAACRARPRTFQAMLRPIGSGRYERPENSRAIHTMRSVSRHGPSAPFGAVE